MAADKDKLTVGQKAPAFSLPDQDDKTVKLGDFKGSWLVLYFYPNDDTPGCTTEACDFTNGLKDFEKLDAVVVGCSPNSTESHRKFIAKYKLKVRLLSDPEHKAMEAYGAWGEKVLYGKKSIGVIRSTAIISPDGKIAHHWAQGEGRRPRRRRPREAQRAPRRLISSVVAPRAASPAHGSRAPGSTNDAAESMTVSAARSLERARWRRTPTVPMFVRCRRAISASDRPPK